MSTINEIKKQEDAQRLQKAKNKVIAALEKDPLGLSIAQLMTICQLSIKTVKNVLAVIDVDQEDGVFFLKGKTKAEIQNKPQVAPTAQPSAPVKPAEEPTAVNISEAFLNLLEDFPDGLNKTDIQAVLKISDKQFSNLTYKLTQAKKIERSGKLGSYIYTLPKPKSEQTQSEPEQPVSEIIEFHTPVVADSTQVDAPQIIEPEQLVKENKMTASNTPVLNALMKLTETQVVQTSTLELTQDQIGQALMEYFDFNRIEWTTDGESLVATMIKTEEMVA